MSFALARRLRPRPLAPLVLALALSGAALASPVPESAYQDLRWRLVGPFRAGWATMVAGVPGDPATWYFGAAMIALWLLSRVLHNNLLLALAGLVILAGPAVVSLLAKDKSRYPKAFGLQQGGNAANPQKHR